MCRDDFLLAEDLGWDEEPEEDLGVGLEEEDDLGVGLDLDLRGEVGSSCASPSIAV